MFLGGPCLCVMCSCVGFDFHGGCCFVVLFYELFACPSHGHQHDKHGIHITRGHLLLQHPDAAASAFFTTHAQHVWCAACIIIHAGADDCFGHFAPWLPPPLLKASV